MCSYCEDTLEISTGLYFSGTSSTSTRLINLLVIMFTYFLTPALGMMYLNNFLLGWARAVEPDPPDPGGKKFQIKTEKCKEIVKTKFIKFLK